MHHSFKKRIFTLFLSIAMVFSITGTGYAGALASNPAGESDKFTFQVLFTSDLHGTFNDWSYSTNSNFTGLARLATKIDELRDENTILIDVGDSIQGNGTSVFNTEKWDNDKTNTTGLYPVIQGFEYLGYDAWVLGNHEFNFGVNRLEKAYGKGTDNMFSGAILAGNIYDKDGNQVYDSYYIKTFENGLTVAVIGMTHPNIVNWDAGNLDGVYTTKSASKVTEETIAYLKSAESEAVNGKIDVFIAAQHMSSEREYEEGSGADDVIAVNGDDLALFIGAHGHMNQDKMIDGVRYVELSSNGGRLGRVEITVTMDEDGEYVVSDKEADVKMTNIVLSQVSDNANFVEANEDYKTALKAYDSFAKAYSNEKIGKLTGGALVPEPEIDGTYEGYLQDTALVHLINDAMLYYTNEYVKNDTELSKEGMSVTLSGTAPLDTNANAQPGDITRGGVSTIYKYDNNTLCIVEMTGEQFKAWMEWGYVYIGPFKGTGYSGFDFGPAMQEGDLLIPYGNGNMPGYNMDQFSGLSYKVDLTKPYGERIVDMTNPDGTPFDLEETYWVAVNNYRADTQLLINADEGSRPAVFPASGTLEPAKLIAREVDSELTVDKVTKDNGEGMLGVMVDYIERVKGGTITNDFEPNWEYILPEIDSDLRDAAVASVNSGLINIKVNNGYSRRTVTASEAEIFNNILNAEDPIVILHTNDVHGRDVAGSASVGTAGVAQLKKDLEAAGAEVLLISAGDAIQGTPLVNIDFGECAIEFMALADYDLMVLGNHEFDWGILNLFGILDRKSGFDTLSANIFYADDNDYFGTPGELVFKANEIYELDGVKIGVFGLTSPESYTKAHPDKIKGLLFLEDEELYAVAQEQVDELKQAGCDVIVCVGHLGTDASSEPNRSTDLIENVSGIDLFVDGHSHTLIANGNPVKDADGNDTMLVSANEQLKYVGIVVYDKETGEFNAGTIKAGNYTGIDSDVAAAISDHKKDIDKTLSEVIGKTEVLLYGKNTTDPAGVRMSETNMGDFAADALLWMANKELGNVDIAITNGGGIRDSIPTSADAPSADSPYSITMSDMVTVFPFGNTVTTITVTGEQLLEALEAAVFSAPNVAGAFPQVAGIEFKIHSYVPYENGEQYPNSTYFAPSKPGARVQDVMIGGKPLDLKKNYVIATNDFTAAGGDTYAVFKKASALNNTGVAMEQALIDYLVEIGGVIAADSDYAEPQGRITYVEK